MKLHRTFSIETFSDEDRRKINNIATLEKKDIEKKINELCDYISNNSTYFKNNSDSIRDTLMKKVNEEYDIIFKNDKSNYKYKFKMQFLHGAYAEKGLI